MRVCTLLRRFLGGLALYVVLAGPFLANAQPLPADSLKYWIFFTDKEGPDGTRAFAAPHDLTSRARERRARRGRGGPSMRRLDAPLPPAYLQHLRREGARPLVESRWLNAVSAYLTTDQAKRLRVLPFVRVIRRVGSAAPPPEPPAHPHLRTGTPEANPAYGPSRLQLALMNALPPLERGISGTGVRLGFLDTRFDFSHPALRHVAESGRLVATRDFTQEDQKRHGSNQESFHGLSVASVAVGYDNGRLIGPAHGAEVLTATTEFAPHERNQEEDNFVAGLEWMERMGADVVNVSLGYTRFDPGERSYTPADLDGDTGVTTRAADIAAALGVVVVTSAGNEACARPSDCWYYIGMPADGDSVIAAGAVAPDSSRASFSSFGPTADGRIKPDVAAMGQQVVAALRSGDYAHLSGTSFSGPLVAGVACQVLQVNPALTPIEVREILRETASQAARPDSALGWGIVNAEAAVRAAEALRKGPLPETPLLVAPYPNPASSKAVFEITAPLRGGRARLALYNILGQRVAVPFDGTLRPGANAIAIDVHTLSSGAYLYVMQGDDLHASGKLMVVR